MERVEKLHRERVSQRGIARATGISRPTIIRWLRKKVLDPIGEPKSGSHWTQHVCAHRHQHPWRAASSVPTGAVFAARCSAGQRQRS